MWRSLRKFALFASLSAASVAVGVGLIASLPVSAWPLGIILLVPATIGGPAVVLAVAIKRGGYSRILGALSVLPLLFLFIQVPTWMLVWDASRLSQRQFLPQTHQHEVLLIQDTYREHRCDAICVQLLLHTDYSVAIEHRTYGWRSLHLAEGPECLEPENKEQYLKLLSQRFITCVVQKSMVPTVNALVVRENYDSNSDIRQRLTQYSRVYELLERDGSDDRLLGRWVSLGRLSDWFFDPIGISESAALAAFDDFDFYAAALGVQFGDSPYVGGATDEEILDALLVVFARRDQVGEAMNAIESLTHDMPPERKLPFRTFLQSRRDELKESNTLPGAVQWIERWLAQN